MDRRKSIKCYGDASTKTGAGGHITVANRVFYWHLIWSPQQLKQINKLDNNKTERNHITTLELWVVVTNFLLFGDLSTDGEKTKRSQKAKVQLEFMVDNMAASTMITNMKSNSEKANRLLQALVETQRKYMNTCITTLKANWLARDLNQAADDLSKDAIDEFKERMSGSGKGKEFVRIGVPNEALTWIFN